MHTPLMRIILGIYTYPRNLGGTPVVYRRPISRIDLSPSDLNRFYSKLVPGPECWGWNGAWAGRRPDPSFSFKGSMWHAVRIAFAIEYGTMDTEMDVDHLCEHPPCMRPDHLEEVTLAENNRRKFLRRTECKAGHPWGPGTWYWDGNARRCRSCRQPSQKLLDLQHDRA